MLISVEIIHTPLNVVEIPQDETHVLMVAADRVVLYQEENRTDYTIGSRPFRVFTRGGMESREYIITRFDTESEGRTFLRTLKTCEEAGIERFYSWHYDRRVQEYVPHNFEDEMLLLMEGQLSRDEIVKMMREAPTTANLSRLIDEKVDLINQRDVAYDAVSTAITVLTRHAKELSEDN